MDSKTATSAKDLLNVEELRSPSSDKNSDTLLTFVGMLECQFFLHLSAL